MDNWRHFMPPGMLLKSAPWSSSLYDPFSILPLKRYCAEIGIPYHDRLTPLPLETFVAYGDAFQRRLAPNVEPKNVRALRREDTAFRLQFERGRDVLARRVVLAVGVHPFRRIPAACAGLPPELVSHSADHGPLDGFAGQDVIVLGAGASASGLAALLQDRGARAAIVARAPALTFGAPAPASTRLGRLAAPLARWIAPETGIGCGWPLKLCSEAPLAFHALPAPVRRWMVATTLGPSGHPLMRDRVIGRVPVYLGQSLTGCRERGGRVEISTVSEGGARRKFAADRLIAATGFRIDMARLAFLDPDILSAIAQIDGEPTLSDAFETSLPGLHVIGPAAALSFGPVSRFVFGARHPARTLVRRLGARASGAAPRPAMAPKFGALR